MIIDGAQIRAGRAMIGWRQHELAAAADVHWNTVSTLENLERLSPAKRRSCARALCAIERALKNEGVLMLSKGAAGVFLAQN